MTFHSIVENWCKLYPEMRHSMTNGNRRFYLADNADALTSMPKQIAPTLSPCVIMLNGVEGTIKGGQFTRQYTVNFVVRARRDVDADAMIEAYEEAFQHLWEFYIWLKQLHENDDTYGREYDRVDLEHPLFVRPVEKMEDGWVAVQIAFTRQDQIDLCMGEGMYIDCVEEPTGPMTFHSIVRHWCHTYKEMLDSATNGNRRFYLADGFDGVRGMPKQIAPAFSPCVVMENGVEAAIQGGLVMRNYAVYFFVRAERMADDDEQMVAYEQALYHLLQFYVWLKHRHENDPTLTGEYSRIDMDEELYVEPAGPLEDGWVAALVQIGRTDTPNLCVDPEMYKPCDNDKPENNDDNGE